MANRELIDRNDLLNIYNKWIDQLALPEDEGDRRGVITCMLVLEDAPVIDAVEVVRCKNCMFGRLIDVREPKYCCVHIGHDGCTQWVDSNHYCGYGDTDENY